MRRWWLVGRCLCFGAVCWLVAGWRIEAQLAVPVVPFQVYMAGVELLIPVHSEMHLPAPSRSRQPVWGFVAVV